MKVDFTNPRAGYAKKRQMANSPSRIINANAQWADEKCGRDCRCGAFNPHWPANQHWDCDKCLGLETTNSKKTKSRLIFI